MPEDQNEQEINTPEAGTPADGETAAQETQVVEAGADEGVQEEADKPRGYTDLSAANEKISALNAENAGWRRKFRELEEKANGLKTPEEFEAALSEYRETITKLEETNLRTEVASAAKLDPKKWAHRLVGSTREELEADAKAIAKDLIRDADEDDVREPRGGLTPGNAPADDLDPAKLAKQVRRHNSGFGRR